MTHDRRHLGPEEDMLWRAVKKTVIPLSGRAPEDDIPPPFPPIHPGLPKTAARHPQAPAPARPRQPDLPTLQLLGRRERQKIVGGSSKIEARLDLHGLRQAEARARLAGFLELSQRRGHKVALVITGKGGGEQSLASLHEPERGVLRRVVPLWLSLPEFRRYVLGFEPAHLSHGGSGALYIRIRKRKP